MSTSGYPYDNSASSMPIATGVDSSFVISANPQTPKENIKKWITVILILIAILGVVVAMIITQKRQSVADIRNFAEENTDGAPQTGFGGLVTTPAKILMDQPPPCLQGETSPFCQSASSEIVSVRITDTPTPTIRPIFRTIASLLSLQETETPEPTATPTQIQQASTSTPTPTQPETTSEPQQTVTATPTSTPVPILSCQRVELFRGSENITQNISSITYGDTIRFIGYVSNTGTQVKSVTFRLTLNDVIKEEKEAPAALSGEVWVAQYEHVFNQYGKHKVTVIAVTPK